RPGGDRGGAAGQRAGRRHDRAGDDPARRSRRVLSLGPAADPRGASRRGGLAALVAGPGRGPDPARGDTDALPGMTGTQHTLADAVGANVRPGDTVLLTVGHSRWTAAARGLPAAVTGSLRHSSMAENDGYAEVETPFGPVGLVSPLVPDVALIHGVAADTAGNVVLNPPLLEGAWGALAARRGAVVT